MNKIISPNSISFDGPFLIGYNSLFELDSIMEEVWENVKTLNKERFKNEVEEKIKLYQNRSKEEVENEIKDSYYFKTNKNLEIFFKNDNILECNSFQDAAIEPSVKNEIPIGFNYAIKSYDNNIEVSLSKYRRSRLNISVSSNNNSISNSLLFKLTIWAESNQSKKWIRLWKDNYPLLWFLFVIYLWIGSAVILNKSDYYKEVLTERAVELLKNGIDSTENFKALELLLYNNYKIIPPNVEVDNSFYKNWIFITAVLLIVVLILSFPPYTYIGIGKGKGKIKFWKIWLKIISVYIPVSIILPIILNKISNLF